MVVDVRGDGWRRWLGVLVCCASLAVSASAKANDSTPEMKPPVAQRAGVGLFAAAGLHNGIGLGARFGLGDVGIEVTGGYQLLYALWRHDDDGYTGPESGIELGSSAHVATSNGAPR